MQELNSVRGRGIIWMKPENVNCFEQIYLVAQKVKCEISMQCCVMTNIPSRLSIGMTIIFSVGSSRVLQDREGLSGRFLVNDELCD